LIPGLAEVFAAAKEAGAYNAIISGAGSTVMAYASPEQDAEVIAEAMVAAFAKQGEHAVYHILDMDMEGVRVI
jgi:homoserine kinase